MPSSKQRVRLGDRGCIIIHGAHDGIQKVFELTMLDSVPNIHIIPCTVLVEAADPVLGPGSGILDVTNRCSRCSGPGCSGLVLELRRVSRSKGTARWLTSHARPSPPRTCS